MSYSLDQDFVAFDLVCDGVPRTKTVSYQVLEGNGIPCVPVLNFCDSLQQALEHNEHFDSKLTRDNFEDDEKHKEAEGIVIEPNNPCWFPNGNRVYFKKKTKRFLEKGGKPNIKHKTVEVLPPELEGVLNEAFLYITEPRFDAVCSKIGEVTIKDIGKVMGLMTQDILVDMQKDDIEIPENKKFMKLLQQQVQNFIRPILLSK